MNKYFKGFFKLSTPLNEFVTQYEEAVKTNREKDANADVIYITSAPDCASAHRIEHQASNVYTENVFKVFYEKWYLDFGLKANQCDDEIIKKRYKVFKRDEDREIDVHYMLDNHETDITICGCNLFNKKCILCKHILKKYVITDRSEIPSGYIMPRWTKAARFGNTPSVSVPRSSQG
ncbi:protein FAR1-RELATED SEQUENCE 9-like [Telopea speciosissima]|uniref:protein FAR1-RELATED SEQUENCE 9-like n=1 Tax=Telopea speciosissima TaxID=54955 RepID=UPI001CC6AFE8|nr:protein FAR1-RELATED SEQUENCE 9-like [Telopea speciosissima]